MGATICKILASSRHDHEEAFSALLHREDSTKSFSERAAAQDQDGRLSFATASSQRDDGCPIIYESTAEPEQSTENDDDTSFGQDSDSSFGEESEGAEDDTPADELPEPVDRPEYLHSEKAFQKLMTKHYSHFSKPFSYRELYTEVLMGESKLEVSDKRIRRVVSKVKVELIAEINGVDKILILDRIETNSGRKSGLNRRLSVKMFEDEDTRMAASRCFQTLFSISPETFNTEVVVERKVKFKETRESTAFPTLMTDYNVQLQRVRVRDPSSSLLTDIGLPKGKSFCTTVRPLFQKGSRMTWVWKELDTWESKCTGQGKHRRGSN